MKNTLFRRVAVGAFATVAAVGLSTLFADAASAHNAWPSGSAVCQDGKYVITWTVDNDYAPQNPNTPSSVKLTNITVSNNGGTHADITLTAKGTVGHKTSFTTESTTDKPVDLILSFDALWQDGNSWWPTNGKPTPIKSDKVHLDGKCHGDTPPSSSPSPSPSVSPKPSASASPSKPASHTPTPEASSSAPGLPVTGSNTTWPMVGTGAALVAGGGVLVVALRRRRRVTFTAE